MQKIRHARSTQGVVTISARLASTATARYPGNDKFLNVAKGNGRSRAQWTE
jgi:hypothetical protein